jgi:putative DNA methylase
MVGQGTNALASSIVLVCRKRPQDAPSVGRAEFLRALRQELPAALKTLQASTIAPVDMAQASIGPGMAVFSRYSEVLEADDTPMSVRTALMLINHELDAFLAEQEGEFDSYSRFAVGWFEQFGWSAGKYGQAEVMATGRGTAVQAIVQAGILRARAGEARLLKRDELDPAWDIRTDTKITVWECCQHLIRRLEGEGEESAARLLKTLRHYGDLARDLAYRLYAVCERKRWAEEARAYNGLIVAWPHIARLAEQLDAEPVPGRDQRQPELAI